MSKFTRSKMIKEIWRNLLIYIFSLIYATELTNCSKCKLIRSTNFKNEIMLVNFYLKKKKIKKDRKNSKKKKSWTRSRHDPMPHANTASAQGSTCNPWF